MFAATIGIVCMKVSGVLVRSQERRNVSSLCFAKTLWDLAQCLVFIKHSVVIIDFEEDSELVCSFIHQSCLMPDSVLLSVLGARDRGQ